MSLACEIQAAAQTRQADLVLQLGRSDRRRGVSDFGEGWIGAAQAVFELAQRMRLPYGRHRAWDKHLQLLQLVCAIVDSGKAAAGNQQTDPAVEAMLLRARKLLGSGNPLDVTRGRQVRAGHDGVPL